MAVCPERGRHPVWTEYAVLWDMGSGRWVETCTAPQARTAGLLSPADRQAMGPSRGECGTSRPPLSAYLSSLSFRLPMKPITR